MTVLTSCHIRKQGGNERPGPCQMQKSPLEIISISPKIGYNDHNQLPPLEVARVPFHYSKKNNKEKEFIYPASSVQRITK